MTNAFRSGFVAILGSPNVGKSTLINALVGFKVAIVSSKAQTTRNKVVGVLTEDDYQIVFLDTPGIHVPKTRLGEFMVRSAKEAARDVDATLIVLDAVRGVHERDLDIISAFGKDAIILINKVDAASKDKIADLIKLLKGNGIFERNICCISALKETGLDELKERLVAGLPEGPQYYPEDMVTDRPERFIASELIREKALLNLRDEIPHGIGVEIEKVEEGDELTKVFAAIYCERDSHKGIVIGKKGTMLKKIGSEARADLEMLFGTKVYLEMFVKVRDDWRNSPSVLKTLGYRD